MLQRHPTARAPPWGRRSCGQPPRPARPPPCRRATTPALPPHVVELAAAAAEPVAKVALLTSVGALCSRAGVLRAEGRRLISTLLLNVFTPALLFSKLGASVGPAEALQDWPLCANMLLLSVAGLALGRAQASLLSIPDRLQTPVVVMSALGNVGNLPLVLVPTIAANPAVGPLDSEEGLRYVLLTYFWACFMQFPLAYTLFGNAARQAQAQADVAVHMSQPPVLSPPAASAAVAAAAAPGGASPAAAGKQTLAAGAEASAYSSTGGLSRWGRAPTSSAVHGLSSSSSGSSRSNGISPHSSSISTSTSSSSNGAGSTSTSSSSSSQPQAASQPSEDWRLLARNVLNPPVMACIAAAAMGSQPALQHALFMPSGSLHVVGDALSLLGQPLVPCLFLVLGSNLAEGPGATPVSPTLVFSMVVSKQLLHPLLGLGLLLGAKQVGVLPPSVDALQLLVMALVWSTPSAVMVHSLATMMQVEEGSVSSLLFWQYLSALVTLPAFLLLLLELLQAGALGT